MLASFSIIPLGVGEELKEYIAEVLKIVAASGLDYNSELYRPLWKGLRPR